MDKITTNYPQTKKNATRRRSVHLQMTDTTKKILIIGDQTEASSIIYRRLGLPPSELVLSADQQYQVGHTSRQDFSNDTEFELTLSRADWVLWGDPDKRNFGTIDEFYCFMDWLKQYQYRHGNIKNFDLIQFDPYSWLPPKISIANNELVALGCSLTAGEGLIDKNQSWSGLVSKKLGLIDRNLGQRGSSLQMMFDVFNRLDIHHGQTVILQVTAPSRLRYVTENNHLQDVRLREKDTPNRLLEVYNSRYLFYLAYGMIISMLHRCRASGARFVFFFADYKSKNSFCHEDQMYFYNVKEFIPNLNIQDYIVDHGTDGIHPGVKSHENLAKSIIEHYNRLYN